MKSTNEAPLGNTEPQEIPINGYQQVVDMLRTADPAFRESLLNRIAAKDPKLAQSLRRNLKP